MIVKRAALAILSTTLFMVTLVAAPASAGPENPTQGTITKVAVVALDSGCEDYRVCVWSQSNYGGTKTVYPAITDRYFAPGYQIRSAKNRFTDRAVSLSQSGGIVRCLNPGSSFPGPCPDNTIYVFVRADGSRC